MIEIINSIYSYGIFVWLSFSVTILGCAVLYYSTYKTLKKYEKDFALHLKKLPLVEQEEILKKSKVANQVLASFTRSI